MANTPNPPRSLVLADDERRIVAALCVARSSARLPQRDRYVASLIADWCTKGLAIAIRQLLAVLRNFFDRRAPEATVLAVVDEIRACVAGWYEVERGLASADFASVHQEEEHREGLQEEAELALVYSKSPGAAAAFIARARDHVLAIQEMIKTACRVRDGATL
jgi:hypothetical protein